jgi:translation initiation factor IF-3
LPRANREITAREVRLIDENGEMLGIFTSQAALTLAINKGLDLIEISPNAEPPVCKITDFGKYKYELQKKMHDARKKQKVIVIKEIKIRYNIAPNDYDVKMRSIRKFIEEGDKVKIMMRFRGREINYINLGMKIFEKIREETAEIAKAELQPRVEGGQILMIIVPISS